MTLETGVLDMKKITKKKSKLYSSGRDFLHTHLYTKATPCPRGGKHRIIRQYDGFLVCIKCKDNIGWASAPNKLMKMIGSKPHGAFKCNAHNRGYMTYVGFCKHLLQDEHYSNVNMACKHCGERIIIKMLPIRIEPYKKRCPKCGRYTKYQSPELDALMTRFT